VDRCTLLSPLARRTLAPEPIRTVVVAHRGALYACYRLEAAQNPPLAGGVTAHWTIDPSGTVVDAQVVDWTLHNERVEKCVLVQIKSWKFPACDLPTRVSFPFSFAP
jgi:hypothetical protein